MAETKDAAPAGLVVFHILPAGLGFLLARLDPDGNVLGDHKAGGESGQHIIELLVRAVHHGVISDQRSQTAGHILPRGAYRADLILGQAAANPDVRQTEIMIAELKAVSYTHLDVYKRQGGRSG